MRSYVGKFWGRVKLSVCKYEVSIVISLLCFLNRDAFPVRTKFQEKIHDVRKLPTHQTKFYLCESLILILFMHSF